MKNKKISKEELWCEYSSMPSPLAYSECVDYDSMGNHGRFVKEKTIKKKSLLAKILKI
jgi:hypothetical protein